MCVIFMNLNEFTIRVYVSLSVYNPYIMTSMVIVSTDYKRAVLCTHGPTLKLTFFQREVGYRLIAFNNMHNMGR